MTLTDYARKREQGLSHLIHEAIFCAKATHSLHKEDHAFAKESFLDRKKRCCSICGVDA